MKRDLQALSRNRFDVLVVGGGVNGLATAWDAASRGLSVALVEQGDFGAATSAGSHKLIHGGLRYLQHLNLRRMRASIRERRRMMFMAPHLVHPLPFVLPCYRHGIKGPEVMAVAMAFNDLVGYDRNQVDDPQKHIPRGHTLSRTESLAAVPCLPAEGLTGAAVFYDAQMYNSERLTLAFALSAADEGAILANYVRADGPLGTATRITGVTAEDTWTGDALEIQARMVLNLTGPWSNTTAGLLGRAQARPGALCKGLQLLTRPLSDAYAFAIEGRQVDETAVLSRGPRQLFVTPWHGKSIIGTTDEPFTGSPDSFRIEQADVSRFVEEFDASCPKAALRPDDVLFWWGGLRPALGTRQRPGSSGADTKDVLVDHRRDGIDGLLTAVGVKYTTCRQLAEKVVDAAIEAMGEAPRPCRTHTMRLRGGNVARFDDFVRETGTAFAIDEETARHLVCNYGSDLPALARLSRNTPSLGERLTPTCPIRRAEVVHAVREEMALTLEDVVMRRTDLGTLGHPGRPELACCAAVMAEEAGWSLKRTEAELAAVEGRYILS